MATTIRRSPRSNPREFSGEFVVSGGAITGGSIKFNKEVTVSKPGGTGLYRFTLVDGKQGRLADVDAWVVGLSGATNGGWSISLAANNIATNGSFDLQFQQQSFAAAEPVGTIIVWFETEGVAAS